MLIDSQLLIKLDRPVPRYTSYPTAPQFYPLDEKIFFEKAALFQKSDRPLSLYIHIPFCKSMCLFCACSVVLNRNAERQNRYFSHLLQEISLVQSKIGKRNIAQLHLGGGTPTNLTEEEFVQLMEHLRKLFIFEEGAELSIEVDPRTVFEDKGKKLRLLRNLKFNRVSFGVQDLDPKVQEGVKRRQTEEMTETTYYLAKELGFSGINIDLIYGLPFQTRVTFRKTAEKLMALKPDRIAFYSYAKVPWLKPHQKAIPEAALPTTEEKFQIYLEAREIFIEAGYTAIGMDHFALFSDSLAKGHIEKKLTRNFQGYSLALAEDLIGLGATSVGFLENAYFQNEKEIERYETQVGNGCIPVVKGFVLKEEDLVRRFVIQSLMCHFELNKREFQSRFALDFDTHFQALQPGLEQLKKEGLLEETEEKLTPTLIGSWFIRLIASQFDAYLSNGKFSKAV